MIFSQIVTRKNHQDLPILLHKVFPGSLRQNRSLRQVLIMTQEIKITTNLRGNATQGLIIPLNNIIEKDMNLVNMRAIQMNIAVVAKIIEATIAQNAVGMMSIPAETQPE